MEENIIGNWSKQENIKVYYPKIADNRWVKEKHDILYVMQLETVLRMYDEVKEEWYDNIIRTKHILLNEDIEDSERKEKIILNIYKQFIEFIYTTQHLLKRLDNVRAPLGSSMFPKSLNQMSEVDRLKHNCNFKNNTKIIYSNVQYELNK